MEDGEKMTPKTGLILVVDDEEVVRTPLRVALETAGHRVEEATDGEEGLAKYRQNPPDVVIVDIFMPRKSGLEMIQELRSEYSAAKIIAVSGVDIRDGLDLETLTRSFGVIKSIQKPFQLNDLLRVIEELLD